MKDIDSAVELQPCAGGWAVRGAKGGGKKGGGGARKPVESPDSLHSTSYARVLDLLSEGEIVGPVNGLRSVYLDETPIESSSGGLNFAGVQVDFRAGTPMQDPIPGFPASESTIQVGVELKAGAPWVRAVNNTNLSAVRVMLGVQGLSQTNTENGDTGGYTVHYAIDLATDGGPYVEQVATAFSGKTTGTYMRTHRIELPPAASGWQVRVRRLTADNTSVTVQDTTVIGSITEVIDARLRYPMSALAGVQIDASQFGNVPTRAYHLRGRIIRVPANYDAESRTYTGVWDGTFKPAYTNNPAWVFFDLVSHPRYGLGRLVPAEWLDKWALYQIAQYCDQPVPDGRGGTEPRFACNVYLQQRADAWRVLQDLASVFRGLVYWGTGTAVAVADMPRDPVYTYAPANVVGGRFSYGGSARSTRYTTALVSWNDLADMGRAKVVTVTDDEGLRRYGPRQTELTAFGCTSEAQARRLGRWVLITSRMETETVSFSVGLDGAICAPGQVIRVADTHRAGRRLAGRIRTATADTVEIDAQLGVQPGDTLTITLPDGITETRTVLQGTGTLLSADLTSITVDSSALTADMVSLPGTTLTLRVAEPFSTVPQAESLWVVESDDLVAPLYRVLAVTEGEGLTFDVLATRHEPGKFDHVDTDTRIEPRPTTVVPPSVMPAPEGVQIRAYSVVWQGTSSQTAVIEWQPLQHAVAYEVEWRRNSGQWVKAGRTGATSLELANIYAGAYLARVRAISALETPSGWGNSMLTDLDGILAAPPTVTALQAQSLTFGVQVKWGLPVGPSIIERTELWYSQTQDRADAIHLGDFAFPGTTHTLMGLAAGQQLYFWARLVDKNGSVGDFYPAGPGISGTASSSATQILQYLNDRITESQLATALLQRIDSGGENSVALEQLVTELQSMYTIKTQLTHDGKPYIAGIGVGVENDQGVITSQVLLSAQRVAVLDESGGTAVTPFVVQGGQVFINEAFIGHASIGSAKLADWLESDAKGPGDVPVLRMNFRTGAIELNAPLGGGGRMTLNNQRLQVYDANGTLRVRLGIW
jgi:predicted phage tail protein